LLIQLLDAPIEAPLARMESGKISETRVHDTGPQVAPKLPMYTQISAVDVDVRFLHYFLLKVSRTNGGPTSSNMRGPVMLKFRNDNPDNDHGGTHQSGPSE
jgi:hypothetical protein